MNPTESTHLRLHGYQEVLLAAGISAGAAKEEIAGMALDLLEDRMCGYDGVGRHRIDRHTIVERETTGFRLEGYSAGMSG